MLRFAFGAIAAGLLLLPTPANAQTYITHPNVGTTIYPYPGGQSSVYSSNITSPSHYASPNYYSFPAYHSYSNNYRYPVYSSNANIVPSNYRTRFFKRWRY